MDTAFWVYLQLGFEHITDPQGYDHILFIIALCAIYRWQNWKELLWLVTAFTVGHSITLALATLNIVPVNSGLIEFLIPVTIFITSISNLKDQNKNSSASRRLKYSLALGFGLIHGLGFSNFLRAVLGQEESIVLPLFSFNVGLEIGQLIIVILALILTELVRRLTRLEEKVWISLLSGMTAGPSLIMIFERFGGLV